MKMKRRVKSFLLAILMVFTILPSNFMSVEAESIRGLIYLKTEDEFDFVFDPEKINVTVDENNVLKIEGTNEIKKGDKEKMISMLQTYKLNKKVNANKIITTEANKVVVLSAPASGKTATVVNRIKYLLCRDAFS